MTIDAQADYGILADMMTYRFEVQRVEMNGIVLFDQSGLTGITLAPLTDGKAGILDENVLRAPRTKEEKIGALDLEHCLKQDFGVN